MCAAQQLNHYYDPEDLCGEEWELNDEEIAALDLQGAASPMEVEESLPDMNAGSGWMGQRPEIVDLKSPPNLFFLSKNHSDVGLGLTIPPQVTKHKPGCTISHRAPSDERSEHQPQYTSL